MTFTRSNVPLTVWILVCTWCSLVGWGLSAVGQLNPAGYAVAMGAGAILLAVTWGRLFPGWRFRFRFSRLRWRHRHLLPAMFSVVAGLAILGGIIHPPNNYDALAYRLPRILHWLSEGQWHWIDTEFARLNTRTCGVEWVSAPVLALLKTDRPLVVINFISFLLLPGVCFSVFTRLGVRPRVAWHWVWILPTGYCFLLQVGGISNDMFCSLLALAAIDLALRAKVSRRWGDLALSTLAASLMTSGKLTNLPLLLPWCLACLPSWRLPWRNPLRTVGLCCVAACVSFLPTAVLNIKHCGDWTGLKAESVPIAKGSPLVQMANNGLLLVMDNLAPPVLPVAGQWNRLMDRFQPEAWRAVLEQRFEHRAACWYAREMPMEDHAGLGFGVSILCLVAAGYCVLRRKGSAAPARRPGQGQAMILIGGVVAALLVVLATSGMETLVRYLGPYYVLLMVPFLRCRAQSDLVSKVWWRAMVVCTLTLVGLLVVVSPSRPLWPALSILRSVGADKAQEGALKRMWDVYSTYACRHNAFQALLELLPKDASPLGLITFDDPTTSLWRPFGGRRIVELRQDDPPGYPREQGIQYVVVGLKRYSETLKYPIPFEDWLRQQAAVVIHRIMLPLRAEEGPTEWVIVRLEKPGLRREDAASEQTIE